MVQATHCVALHYDSPRKLVNVVTVDDSRVKVAIKRNLTCRNLWCWMFGGCGVFRSEVNKQPTIFLLDLYKCKASRSSEQKSNLNYKTRELLNQFQDWASFTDPETLKGSRF